MNSRADRAVVGLRSLRSAQGRLSTVVGASEDVVGHPSHDRRRTTNGVLGFADCRRPTTDDPSPLDPSLRIAVLAAHPDDESIGASVLLARATNVIVIYLTDGAPQDARLWPPDFKGSRNEYTNLRRKEAVSAVSLAGITENEVIWLGAADQETIFSASELSTRLRELLTKHNIHVLITHPYEGGHPDHDTAALVARLAISQMPATRAPLIVEMTSYHARDGQCLTGEFLNSSPGHEIVFELCHEDRHRKQKMFDAHASQQLVLRSFATTTERFRRAPEYDFSQPPHEGRLWYECMGWSMTGEHWRKLALQARARLQEFACR